jgi:hypothetical protein
MEVAYAFLLIKFDQNFKFNLLKASEIGKGRYLLESIIVCRNYVRNGNNIKSQIVCRG